MTPEAFWRLHPREFWWMVEALTPQKRDKFGLSQSDVDELLQVLEDESAKEKADGA